ncbi:hypothetical protein [Saccharopolyspora elongata]|uniref:hypothetical protein n=1 Tax=Saccharopolyspora elongata TaxID=2530387 RepID=UPI00104B97A6|nr:hypothetical protein [Saccharopolyspora elongata]
MSEPSVSFTRVSASQVSRWAEWGGMVDRSMGELIRFLEVMAEFGRRGAQRHLQHFRFLAFAELLLTEGRVWHTTVEPERFGATHGPERECYSNATSLAESKHDLIYVEGFGLPAVMPLGTEHAWCVPRTDDGVIEVTWPRNDGLAYIDLPFTDEFRRKIQHETDRLPILLPHTEAGRSLLQDGPPADAIVDVGQPIAEVYVARR